MEEVAEDKTDLQIHVIDRFTTETSKEATTETEAHLVKEAEMIEAHHAIEADLQDDMAVVKENLTVREITTNEMEVNQEADSKIRVQPSSRSNRAPLPTGLVTLLCHHQISPNNLKRIITKITSEI